MKIELTRVLAFCVATVSVATQSGCEGTGGATGSSAGGGATARRASPTLVQVYEVESPPGEILIPATLATDATAVVLAPRDGLVIALEADEGARVAKGQALARLSDDDLGEALHQAELDVDRLGVEEQQNASLLKVRQVEMQQEGALLKEGLTSQRQFDRAQYTFEASQHELEKTRLLILASRAKVDQARREVEKAVIRAPIAGIVTRRYARLGSGVVRNDRLFEVAQLSPLEVRFRLPRTDRVELSPGSLVPMSRPGGDALVGNVRVRHRDPLADTASDAVGYVADVLPTNGLTAGMPVTLHVRHTTDAGTVWVPRACFAAGADLRPGSMSVIFVIAGQRSLARTVRIAAAEADRVEIDSGLAAGERVVLVPPSDLQSGDAVVIGPP